MFDSISLSDCQDILQVEEKLFSLISQNVSTGGQRTTNIVEKNVVGREGESVTLKCRLVETFDNISCDNIICYKVTIQHILEACR